MNTAALVIVSALSSLAITTAHVFYARRTRHETREFLARMLAIGEAAAPRR